TLNNIGLIYAKKGERDKALEYYLKSEKIMIEVEDKVGLGTTYNSIGLIYDKKGEWDKALEYYLKSEKILIEVGDKAGLVYTAFNINNVYMKKKEFESAIMYAALGFFTGKRLGMNHELAQMAWLLDFVREKVGEDELMRMGQEMAEKRGIVWM
ncbi:MAG: tetratricopeptide repeat protein, partial [Spirochaetales bacterium]|nr:tetratricopeptide repeat protein [Spirochaetales bacterium]